MRTRGEKGGMLVEGILSIPFLIFLLVTVFDLAEALRTYFVLSQVAREGVRIAMTQSLLEEGEFVNAQSGCAQPCLVQVEVQKRMSDILRGLEEDYNLRLSPNELDRNITTRFDASSREVSVTLSVSYSGVFPTFAGFPLKVSHVGPYLH